MKLQLWKNNPVVNRTEILLLKLSGAKEFFKNVNKHLA